MLERIIGITAVVTRERRISKPNQQCNRCRVLAHLSSLRKWAQIFSKYTLPRTLRLTLILATISETSSATARRSALCGGCCGDPDKTTNSGEGTAWLCWFNGP